MALSNLGYSFREVGQHFKRSWGTVIGAVVTIFLSLFIIGLFLLGSAMLENMVGTVEDRVTIQAFLSDDADQDAVVALQRKVQGWDNIESVTYKSKDEALEEYKNTMSNRNAADAVAALDGENPIPASLVIKLTDPQLVSDTANKLIRDSDFISVSDGDPASAVQYGRETVEKLFSFTNYLRIGALVLVGLLTFVAFVFINNTIRLAITARRREISIMRLVGASNGFIRGPFLLEGTLEAIVGALLAI
ncbi:MAG: ABC transporter permease, partial [Atopobiaceae bacterium]|nr:ABC transporter permease [Atopobiaceae bacterium]